jgi:hypothetical protein
MVPDIYRGGATYSDDAVPLHDGDLDVFRPGLDHLKQALHRELDALLPGHVILVVLLEEFANRLG